MKRNSLIVSSLVAVLGLGVAACSKKGDNSGGLPPATQWKAGDPGAPTGGPATGANPHAQVGEPAAQGADPHGGVAMGGAAAGTPDVTQLGLQGPDPQRAIDPNHFVSGVIRPGGALTAAVKLGTPVFIIVKRADATGAPVGAPLAVEKLTLDNPTLPFKLTEANAMIAGTELTGDVIVMARYDQDGDAISKMPGDFTGSIRVTVPAKDIDLVMDQPIAAATGNGAPAGMGAPQGTLPPGHPTVPPGVTVK